VEKMSKLFNIYIAYFTGGSTMKTMVDLDGNIELPKVGKIHVAGLSKDM
jgi:protein involved in polysaccharide export with SLBB domain